MPSCLPTRLPLSHLHIIDSTVLRSFAKRQRHSFSQPPCLPPCRDQHIAPRFSRERTRQETCTGPLRNRLSPSTPHTKTAGPPMNTPHPHLRVPSVGSTTRSATDRARPPPHTTLPGILPLSPCTANRPPVPIDSNYHNASIFGAHAIFTTFYGPHYLLF